MANAWDLYKAKTHSNPTHTQVSGGAEAWEAAKQNATRPPEKNKKPITTLPTLKTSGGTSSTGSFDALWALPQKAKDIVKNTDRQALLDRRNILESRRESLRSANVGGVGTFSHANDSNATRIRELDDEIASVDRFLDLQNQIELQPYEQKVTPAREALSKHSIQTNFARRSRDLTYEESKQAAKKADELRREVEKKQRGVEGIKYKQGYQDITRDGSFTGQFSANYDIGQMGEDEALAWNTYLNDPTEENRIYAESVSAAREAYMARNQEALEADTGNSWISKDLAGYLPQFLGQNIAGIKGGLGGAAAGTVLPVAGTAAGAKAGYAAGRALYGYETARGRVFKSLLDAGVPEDQARLAANDEAIVSSVIEGGDAVIDMLTLGFGNLLKKGGTAAAKSTLPKILRNYGINIGSEGLQEWTQEGVSIANQKRNDTGILNLVQESAGQMGRAISGQDPEALEQMNQAGLTGLKIAAMMGGGGIAFNTALSKATSPLMLPTADQENGYQKITEQDAINRFNQNVNNRTAFVPDNPLVNTLPTVSDALYYAPGSPAYRGAQTAQGAQTQQQVNMQPSAETSTQRSQGVQIPVQERTWQDAGNRQAYLEARDRANSGVSGNEYSMSEEEWRSLMGQEPDGPAVLPTVDTTPTRSYDETTQTQSTGGLTYGRGEEGPSARQGVLGADVRGETGGTETLDSRIPSQGDSSYGGIRQAESGAAKEAIIGAWARGHLIENPSAGSESSLGSDSVGGGSVGAMRSNYDYRQNTSRVSNNTFSKMYQDAIKNIEQNGGNVSGLTYDVVTERQSMDNAQQRLFTDLEGEINDLPKLDEWGGEDLDTAMGILDRYMAEAIESGDYGKVNEWAKLIQSKGTKAGQMIQAFAKYSRTPQGVMVDAVRALENSKLNNQKKAEVLSNVQEQIAAFYDIPDGDTQSLIDLIKQNSAIRRTGSFFRNKTSKALNAALERDSYDHLRNVALAQIDSIAKDYQTRTAGEKLRSARSMFILSNITTVLRNFVGNQIFDPIDSFAGNTSVVPLDTFLSKFTGTRSVAAENPFSVTKWRGAIENARKSYIEVALDVSTDGVQNRYDQTSNRTFKMTGNPLERFLSTWAKYQGYALNTTDEFAKGGVQAETQRRIDRLKERGLVADDTLDRRGKEQAKYRTFQDDTRLSRTMLQARDAANNVGVNGFGAGDLLMPHARVPANLVTRAVEYSPLGLTKGTYELVDVLKKAHNGTLTAADQAKAVSDIGRGITGTGLIAAFGALAAAGFIRVAGGGEGEEDKTALETSEGISGTQINLSGALRWIRGEENALEWRKGDQLMSIGFLEPLNAQMTTGALLAQELDGTESIGEKVKTFFKSSFDGTLQSLLDLPAMSSLQDLVDGYSYSPAETTGGKVADALTSFAASQVSSFVPNIIRGVAKATDPYVRDAYSSGTTLGELIDKIKMSIPGLRQTLPIKQTPFGEDRIYGENQVINALNSIFLPGALTEYRTSDAAQELYSLPSVDETPVYPRRSAPNSLSYDKTDYELSADQKTQYQKVYGQTYQSTIDALTASNIYDSASGEDKTRMVNMAREYASELAKRDFLKSQGVNYTPEGWIGGAIKNGIDPEKYLVYAFTADADGNNSVSQSESAAALLPMRNLTNAEKGKVWQSQNSSWNEKKNPFTGALSSAGIDAKTATSILEKYSEVYNTDIKAGDQAAELSKFLDGLNLTTEQRAVVDDTYKFYTMFPAKPTSYNLETMSDAAKNKWPRVQAWGMSEEDYLKYYPMVSSGKKADCLQKLQNAGMTQTQANYFWSLVKSK